MQNKITLKPLTLNHLPLLHIWLQEPHVKAFYDQDVVWTEERIFQKFGSYIEGFKWEGGIKKPIYPLIIHLNEEPIGYVQYYNAYDFTQDGYDLSAKLGHAQVGDGTLAAFDIFIGAKHMTSQGIGSAAIRKLLEEHIWKKFTTCLVDPKTSNPQAVRAFEKAGFRTLSSGKNHLMFCHKTSFIPTFIRTGVYGVAVLGSKILVIQQKKGVHEGKFDLPGGGIEPGEPIDAALRREFQEEVGMSFSSMTHLCNLTAITENIEKSMRLHQIGLIYRVENVCKIENQNTELEHLWLEVEKFENLKLTPFLKSILTNLKKSQL